MSRTVKDWPGELGGKRHRYYTSPKQHSWFTRMCRRTARSKANQELRKGLEPMRVYPIEKAYYD